MKIPIIIEIEPSCISNVFVGAIEGGYSPWLGTMRIENKERWEVPWYGDENFFDKDQNSQLEITVSFDDPDGVEGTFTGSKVLHWADIEKGFLLLYANCKQQFKNLMEDNDDALTHDLIMQYIILGDHVYA